MKRVGEKKQEVVYRRFRLHERQNIPLIKCKDIIGLTERNIYNT